MSVTSGGTAPNGCSAGGRSSVSAGSAGIVITLSTANSSPSRYQRHTDADRSSVLTTTPTNPQVASGSCAGPQLQHHLVLRPEVDPLQVLALGEVPEVQCVAVLLPPSSSSGTTPSSIIDGVPHSLVISVFWLRCHQAS